jgi:hypothetical protein
MNHWELGVRRFVGLRFVSLRIPYKRFVKCEQLLIWRCCESCGSITGVFDIVCICTAALEIVHKNYVYCWPHHIACSI